MPDAFWLKINLAQEFPSAVFASLPKNLLIFKSFDLLFSPVGDKKKCWELFKSKSGSYKSVFCFYFAIESGQILPWSLRTQFFPVKT